jgi:ABC-type branched-subunit amino acid transport system ATPase component
MKEKRQSDGWRIWFWSFMFLLFIGGLLIAIVIPNITGSWPSKTGEIINNLRQIDAAKNEWAIEHGFTNYSQIVEMTNQLTKLDLIQILSRRSDKQTKLFLPLMVKFM